jgi:FtsH-binding integral membrane protein
VATITAFAAGSNYSEFAMNDISRLFQAFVAPAIFFSATALFILSINVRLMGIVSRLRQYVRGRNEAIRNGRTVEGDACAVQIESMEQRAEMIRRTFLLSLIALVGTLLSCLLLGLGLYWKPAALGAAAVFVAAMIALLSGVLYYIREVTVALSSVRQEADDDRLAHLDAPESHGHSLF